MLHSRQLQPSPLSASCSHHPAFQDFLHPLCLASPADLHRPTSGLGAANFVQPKRAGKNAKWPFPFHHALGLYRGGFATLKSRGIPKQPHPSPLFSQFKASISPAWELFAKGHWSSAALCANFFFSATSNQPHTALDPGWAHSQQEKMAVKAS